MPANLKILKVDKDGSRVEVTIQEGKFHQVKRMFLSRGKSVVYLRRISFGAIQIDENIKEGEYRELSDAEFNSITEGL